MTDIDIELAYLRQEAAAGRLTPTTPTKPLNPAHRPSMAPEWPAYVAPPAMRDEWKPCTLIEFLCFATGLALVLIVMGAALVVAG